MSVRLLATAEVTVVGGGTAGAVAAIAAARSGADVLLVEHQGFLGGLSTGGLVNSYISFHDSRGRQAVRGIGQEIVERLRKVNATSGHVEDSIGECYSQTLFDSETLKYVLQEMVEEAGVKLLFYSFACDLIMEDNTLKGIIVQNKSGRQLILTKVCVDATGDADVAALAGATFQKEPRERIQAVTLMFRMAGVNTDQLIAYMKEHPNEFKLVIDPKDLSRRNMIGNELQNFPAWRKAIENREFPDGIVLEQAWFVTWGSDMERNEITINATRVDNVDGTDVFDLTNAQLRMRKQVMRLVDFFKKNLAGFQHAYLLTTASQLGVRETRRVTGEYILTKDDVLKAAQFDDLIAKGATPVDVHGGREDRGKQFWIKTSEKGILAYDIPYRCLVSKNVDNLLVAGRCISATHEAQGAIRMMPVCMATGQAAGVGAALAVKEGVSPKKLDVSLLQQNLMEQGQVLALP